MAGFKALQFSGYDSWMMMVVAILTSPLIVSSLACPTSCLSRHLQCSEGQVIGLLVERGSEKRIFYLIDKEIERVSKLFKLQTFSRNIILIY